MSDTIRLAIMGYGNLGRGVELAAARTPDVGLKAVFTRRDPSSVEILTPGVPVLPESAAADLRDEIDVLILCGGSASDLPVQGPKYASLFNTVDSFDTHAKIPEHLAAVDAAARKGGKVSVISAGWDPGLFSLNRLMGESILPDGETYTFWGPGVSQGHSDAVRRIEGVAGAVQYTVPSPAAVEAARGGSNPKLTAREKHTRVCYVAVTDGVDKSEIERKIKTMPNYFEEYDTTVNFVTLGELKRSHGSMPHGGFVIRSGVTGGGAKHVVEYSLKLESNPEFTSSVLLCCARAAYRMFKSGDSGAKTLFDIPPALLSPKSREALLGIL